MTKWQMFYVYYDLLYDKLWFGTDIYLIYKRKIVVCTILYSHRCLRSWFKGDLVFKYSISAFLSSQVYSYIYIFQKISVVFRWPVKDRVRLESRPESAIPCRTVRFGHGNRTRLISRWNATSRWMRTSSTQPGLLRMWIDMVDHVKSIGIPVCCF